MKIYLSRVTLNPTHPDVRAALDNPYRMHKLAYTLLGRNAPKKDGSRRILWRLEPLKPYSPPIVLAQTVVPPDARAFLAAGWGIVETRPIKPVLEAGAAYRFRIQGNTIRRLSTGKVRELRSAKEQVAWLNEKLVPRGLSPRSVLPVHTFKLRFKKPGGALPITLLCTLFEGVVVVSDPKEAEGALFSGIGRAKGFGCGMLSLRRARQASDS